MTPDNVVIRTRAAIARDQHGKLHQLQELTTFVRDPQAQQDGDDWQATTKSLALGRALLQPQDDGTLQVPGADTTLTVVRWGRELPPDEQRALARESTYGEILATRTHKYGGLDTTERVLHALQHGGEKDTADRSARMLARLVDHMTKAGTLPEGELDRMLLDLAR